MCRDGDNGPAKRDEAFPSLRYSVFLQVLRLQYSVPRTQTDDSDGRRPMHANNAMGHVHGLFPPPPSSHLESQTLFPGRREPCLCSPFPLAKGKLSCAMSGSRIKYPYYLYTHEYIAWHVWLDGGLQVSTDYGVLLCIGTALWRSGTIQEPVSSHVVGMGGYPCSEHVRAYTRG